MLFQVTNPPSRHFILYYQFYLLLIWWKEYLEKTFIRLEVWWPSTSMVSLCTCKCCLIIWPCPWPETSPFQLWRHTWFTFNISANPLIALDRKFPTSHSSRWSLIGIFLLCWEIMCLQRVGGSQHNSRVQNFEIFMLHREVKKVWVYWCWFALRWPIRITGML